jgi:N-acetylneuraminate synthase
VPCYKIASFENTDLPLIRRVAQTGKPVIISTGLASEAELEEMVATVRHEGCDDLILLKCTSAYPASPEAANLRTIADIRKRFKVQVGLSDHTLGLAVPLAAVACGATVIEKHFTLSRADGGVDAAFSLEPNELAELVVESERAWQAMGQVSYELSDKEKQSCKFRRSLYIVEDLKAGETLTEKNVRAIRPGGGLSPGHYDEVIGKTMRVDAVKGTPLNWKLLD